MNRTDNPALVGTQVLKTKPVGRKPDRKPDRRTR